MADGQSDPEGYEWSPEEVAESKALALRTGKITGERYDGLVAEVIRLRTLLQHSRIYIERAARAELDMGAADLLADIIEELNRVQ